MCQTASLAVNSYSIPLIAPWGKNGQNKTEYHLVRKEKQQQLNTLPRTLTRYFAFFRVNTDYIVQRAHPF